MCLPHTEHIPTYTLHADTDCYGNGLIEVRDAAVPQQCAEICDSTEGCVGFVFDKRSAPSQNCYCKAVCEDMTALPDVNTYTKGTNRNKIWGWCVRYMAVGLAVKQKKKKEIENTKKNVRNCKLKI